MAYVLQSTLPLIKEYAPDGKFMASPYWPGLYAIAETKSPVFDIYALFKRDPEFQKAEIRRLQEANGHLVLIQDTTLDGNADMRFSRTHAIENEWVRQNYREVQTNVGKDVHVYVGD
jgi:hypothetical protein